MRRWAALIVICVGLALAAGAHLHYTRQPSLKLLEVDETKVDSGVPPETRRQIELLKSLDAVAYARAAIAKGDFRHVRVDKAWQSSDTPGILCLADLTDVRHVFFSDMIGPGDTEIWERQEKLAKLFNPAIVGDPSYPDKDVCLLSPPMAIADAIDAARDKAREPRVTDLATAVRAQDLNAVNRFVASGADVNASDRWQSTPLVWAIRRKNRPIFDALLAAGADIHEQGGATTSPLIVATEVGDVPFLRTVLKAGTLPTKANPVPRGWRNSTSIHVATAVSVNRVDVLDLLLEYEAVPGPEDAWDYPLSVAMESGCLACIEKILAFGGPTLSGSNTVFKLLTEELERKPQRDILMPLARAALPAISYSPNATGALGAAIDSNRRRALKYLLLNSQNVNFLTSVEADALAAAAAADDGESMSALVATASQRRRAVDDAILRGDDSALRKLITKRILGQNHTLTPLMFAAKVGTPGTVRTLIELGANVETRIGHRTSSGGYSEAETNDATALYVAIGAANLETTRALLEKGANINATIGWRPLLADVGGLLSKHSDQTWSRFVDLLIEKTPANHRQATADLLLNSVTPPYSTGSQSRMKPLLAYGADSCARGLYDNALANTASGGSFETYQLLLKHCRRWKSDQTLQKHTFAKVLDTLFSAFDRASEQEKIALDLLARKVPLPDNFEQRSYLCALARSGSIALIEALVAAGADINAIDYDRTALDCVGKDAASVAARAQLRRMGAKTFDELGVKKPETPFPF